MILNILIFFINTLVDIKRKKCVPARIWERVRDRYLSTDRIRYRGAPHVEVYVIFYIILLYKIIILYFIIIVD